jgi:hypothetical protein
VITSAWALGFTASSVLCALIIRHDKTSKLTVIVQIAAFVVPMAFTKLYSERVKAAGAAAAASAAS